MPNIIALKQIFRLIYARHYKIITTAQYERSVYNNFEFNTKQLMAWICSDACAIELMNLETINNWCRITIAIPSPKHTKSKYFTLQLAFDAFHKKFRLECVQPHANQEIFPK